MKHTTKCLKCYDNLDQENQPYHEKCSKIIFGMKKAPDLPYALNELSKLAEKVIKSSVTVPGVQAKISLHYDIKGNYFEKFTIVGLWGNFILKPPVDKYPEMPEIEDLTMHLAQIFNIDTINHSLIRLKSGELAYITKRIDRDNKGNKIHMEDMCQLTGRLTEHKYLGSMEQVGKAILNYSSYPLFDAINFFECSLFCLLTGNADMHLKNFSLLYNNYAHIKLSPFYDLLSTRLLIPESKDPEEMALSLNGKKAKLNLKDFIMLSKILTIREEQLRNSLKKFRQCIPNAIEFVDRGFISSKKKKEFKTLIKNRAERLNLI